MIITRSNVDYYAESNFRFRILDILLEFIVLDEFLPCLNND